MERPLWGGPPGAPKKEKKENPHRASPGFAKWKIVHAEYTGDDEETFVAHLRSGKSRRFVIRAHVDSDDYCSINEALGIDGDADFAVGELVQMSTNKDGPKDFMRAAPKPWSDMTIVSGQTNDDGSAVVRAVFHHDRNYEGNMRLSEVDLKALATLCGGEDEAIGVRVRYRLMPDDTIEFRQIEVEQAA